ncbi:hypothetical protein [Paraburkholderia fungorum]|uniref:Uncharacterized protein n=1 Tax=Paraburkholderia fungorum TaxID=134537 RepID=A0AAW3V675_9BURK|nr:hypothetical protein [Paraburkholderia fungorum]AJZ56313.1 hypothetical protein OI25_7991 [Paraburkholderia fungorum]MBB4519904.1 hypothetical protein [Paraburkholderia fungorum]MBB5546791.1 hypothetical protein [Paraburkholderia fungorum]MBB6205230.1 hypothetical protein [Paraburkholderia fungorum]MBU7442977.1 hypothetical protein [Paraburkholderia fungorum]
MSTVTTKTPSAALARAAYLRAKVLDSLSDQCHAQGLLFDALNYDEMAEAYREAHHSLAEQARKLFPLYPHPDFMAGREWANANGFDE